MIKQKPFMTFLALAVFFAGGLAFGQQTSLDGARTYHKRGDMIHIDSSDAQTGTWTCAVGSTTCTEDGTAGNAIAELTIGDKISIDDRTYYVESITDDDNFERRREQRADGTYYTLHAATSQTVYIIGTGVSATEATLRDGVGHALPLGLSLTTIYADGQIVVTTDADIVFQDTASLNLFNYYDGSIAYLAIGDGSIAGASPAVSDVVGSVVVGPGTPGAPSLAFVDSGGGVTDGFYSVGITTLGVGINGSNRWNINTAAFYSNSSSGPLVANTSSSTTTPLYAFVDDQDTGISGGAVGNDGQISLISDGVEVVHVDSGVMHVTGVISSSGNIGAYPPATCTAGTTFIDTDETDDTNFATTTDNAQLLCVATDTWVFAQGNS